MLSVINHVMTGRVLLANLSRPEQVEQLICRLNVNLTYLAAVTDLSKTKKTLGVPMSVCSYTS
jgi:hypothetical protein